MTPDLRARHVLMSAHLYYDRSCAVLSDGEFDRLCEQVALGMEEFENFDDLLGSNLTDYRMWMLGGSPDRLRATAHHVKITQSVVGGAESWFEDEIGEPITSPYRFIGQHDATFGVQWTGVRG